MEMDKKNTQNNELLKKKILGFRRVLVPAIKGLN